MVGFALFSAGAVFGIGALYGAGLVGVCVQEQADARVRGNSSDANIAQKDGVTAAKWTFALFAASMAFMAVAVVA